MDGVERDYGREGEGGDAHRAQVRLGRLHKHKQPLAREPTLSRRLARHRQQVLRTKIEKQDRLIELQNNLKTAAQICHDEDGSGDAGDLLEMVCACLTMNTYTKWWLHTYWNGVYVSNQQRADE